MHQKQYEERIKKLEDALAMQKLMNTSQRGRLRVLDEELEKTRIALEEEREEKEKILKDRQTNRLIFELQEERVQRLQDLEEIYAKEKQIEAMIAGANNVTQEVSHLRDQLKHKEAELDGLRATLRCSAKLLKKTEEEFGKTRETLGTTQLKLLDCSRKLTSKEKESTVWILRYEQVMLDLHAAQFRLAQQATTHTSVDEALTRGYEIDRTESDDKTMVLRSGNLGKVHGVTKGDRAVRKYRRDIIPNRTLAMTASLTALPHVGNKSSKSPTSGRVSSPKTSSEYGSRECFQCSDSPTEPPKKLLFHRSRRASSSDTNISNPQHKSKYLGHGLGLLKRDNLVPVSNNYSQRL